ncbi:hypothetical protein AVEN_54635-1 [Araneus ventricosus]|uniref:Uncharacterized protein n=1 Tax=Araneus ventricosus TaxID=182803 RepID=A0A4Y2BMR1_ARAVE|nr:hypothetical protein AVEN_54635-1 [Araneus ventricosus]
MHSQALFYGGGVGNRVRMGSSNAQKFICICGFKCPRRSRMLPQCVSCKHLQPSGESSLTPAKMLQYDLSGLLRRGGFELHEWVLNHSTPLNDISTSEYSFEDPLSNTIKALRILWKPQSHQLTFKVSIHNKDVLSKREELSQIARVYDPLGIIGPL